MQNKMWEEEEPETLKNVIDTILEIPGYEWSLKYGMEPQIHAGSKENRAGKIRVLGFTSGTDWGDDIGSICNWAICL